MAKKDVKTCECDAISLLELAAAAYEKWLDDMKGAEPLFATLHDEFISHLDKNIRPMKNKTPFTEKMQELRTKVAEAKAGKRTHVSAMEGIRTTLHQKPAFRQVFVCGPAFNGKNESVISRELLAALEILENGEPSDAFKHLKGVESAHSCGSS